MKPTAAIPRPNSASEAGPGIWVPGPPGSVIVVVCETKKVSLAPAASVAVAFRLIRTVPKFDRLGLDLACRSSREQTDELEK